VTNAAVDALRRDLAEPLPQPDAAQRAAWAARAAEWALNYFATLPEQPIGTTATRTQMEALLSEPPPETGRAFDAVLREFETKITPHAFRTNHPRFLDFVPSAPCFPSVLAEWLCAAANFFCGVWLEAQGPTQVELLVLDWFKEFLGCPSESRGILTSGGSEANLTALVVARDRLPVSDRGRAVLYVSEHRHWSVDRAASVIGLQPDQIYAVPADADFRLTPAALNQCVSRDRIAGRLPWCAVANAGATRTGTVDSLRSLADYCRSQGLWFHVDAAYGWAAALTPEGVRDLDGIGAADSITFDPHKWFGQTFEVGGLLVRDGRLLPATFAQRPDYLQDVMPAEEEVNFCDHGIALTRRFRALKIWLSVKVLGVGWFRSLADRCCRLADYAQVTLQQTGDFEILCPRNLSIVCFRYVPPDRNLSDNELDHLNLTMLEELRKTGRAFLSSTRLKDRVAMRMCFINWRTTSGDVDEIVQLLREIGGRLLG